MLFVSLQPLKLGREQRLTLLDRRDLTAKRLAPIVERYDLIGLINVLTLGPVALKGVVGVDLAELGESLLSVAGHAGSFARRLFFRLELSFKFGLGLRCRDQLLL